MRRRKVALHTSSHLTPTEAYPLPFIINIAIPFLINNPIPFIINNPIPFLIYNPIPLIIHNPIPAGPALFRGRLRVFGQCTNGVAFSKGRPNLASVRLTL